MKNKLLLLVFTMLMVVSAWADTFVVDGIKYSTSGTEAKVTRRLVYAGNGYDKNSYSGNITIPATVTYGGTTYSVTGISYDAFSSCDLTSVTIPSSVTSIGNNAFAGCHGLTSITIPSSVTSIGDNAFRGCSSLTSITILGNVTSIGSNTFYDCSGLTSITIPSSVTSIGEDAFHGCSGLTSITIPGSVTSIGMSAFAGCSGLASVVILDGVSTIGDNAFYCCYDLTSIEMPNSVTSIGNYMFGDCSSLASVMIPEGVTSIGNNAFYCCYGLTNITIPEGMRSIGTSAFQFCFGLTSVEIPSSVTSIGKDAFKECIFAKDNFVNSSSCTSNDYWGARIYEHETTDGLIIDKNVVVFCRNKATIVEIPSSVTSIGNDAFYDCRRLTSINIPNSVTSIGRSAFNGCSSLTSITIPQGVTSIGDYAFNECSGLKQVVTDNKNVGMIKSALGRDKTYIVPCSLYYKYVDEGLTTTKQHNLVNTKAITVTCTTDGNIEYYTCNDCSKHFSDAEAQTEIAEDSWVIAAIGHEWGGWTTTKDATCVEKGSKQRVCAHDASHVDVADIDINSNNHTNVVTDNAVAATCTETGLTEGSHCEACHATVVAQETIAALGHSFTSYIYNNDATTLVDGTETAHCDHNCGTTDTHTAEGTKLVPTGVGQVSGNGQKVVKTVEDGRIVIIRDGVKYDIMGREL